MLKQVGGSQGIWIPQKKKANFFLPKTRIFVVFILSYHHLGKTKKEKY